MPIVILFGGFALLAYYVYTQSLEQSDLAEPSYSGVPGSVIGADGIPVSLPNTRGFRNNNPGNLRYIAARPFNGQTGSDLDGYGIYDTLANGVRAMGKQLDNYATGFVSTVTDVISKWAPSNENDTQAYIADVSARMNIGPDDPLVWPGDKIELVDAIIIHENGSNPLSTSDLYDYLNS